MTIEIKGTVKVKDAVVQVSDKFSKQIFVITTEADSKYPQHISIEAQNDAISKLDSIGVGMQVKAVVNLNGREWTKDGVTKYFNTLTLFKIEVVNESAY